MAEAHWGNGRCVFGYNNVILRFRKTCYFWIFKNAATNTAGSTVVCFWNQNLTKRRRHVSTTDIGVRFQPCCFRLEMCCLCQSNYLFTQRISKYLLCSFWHTFLVRKPYPVAGLAISLDDFATCLHSVFVDCRACSPVIVLSSRLQTPRRSPPAISRATYQNTWPLQTPGVLTVKLKCWNIFISNTERDWT